MHSARANHGPHHTIQRRNVAEHESNSRSLCFRLRKKWRESERERAQRKTENKQIITNERSAERTRPCSIVLPSKYREFVSIAFKLHREHPEYAHRICTIILYSPIWFCFVGFLPLWDGNENGGRKGGGWEWVMGACVKCVFVLHCSALRNTFNANNVAVRSNLRWNENSIKNKTKTMAITNSLGISSAGRWREDSHWRAHFCRKFTQNCVVWHQFRMPKYRTVNHTHTHSHRFVSTIYSNERKMNNWWTFVCRTFLANNAIAKQQKTFIFIACGNL